MLEITQEANFQHTFVLSSVANTTIPSTDTASELYGFFHAHPPLINVSLGSTPGGRVWANFTAPAAGTYEFVCDIPGHFQAGMHGVLTSGSGSTAPAVPAVWVYVGIGVVIVVAVAIGVALASRRRRRPPAPVAAPTSAPPSA